MNTYSKVLDALGDPTRRAIFERLRFGPTAVGELARELPVSRPAVSQHLRVLRRAGLVLDEPDGARRLYRIDARGVGALRAYVDEFWNLPLARYKEAAVRGGEEIEMTTSSTELVVRKSVLVQCDVDRAFDVFTRGIGDWWPLGTHSLGHERAVRVVLERGAGGRLYEVWDDGSERHWGTITAWEPPHRVTVSWKVNPDALAPTEWEARFSPESGGTRLELVHRGFEDLGDTALDSHASYLRGWDTVLAGFAGAAARS